MPAPGEERVKEGVTSREGRVVGEIVDYDEDVEQFPDLLLFRGCNRLLLRRYQGF